MEITPNMTTFQLNHDTGLSTVTLMRCGQSVFNEKGLFCGWYDSELSKFGKKEATSAAEIMKGEGIGDVDVVYTSELRRAIMTTDILVKHLDHKPPILRTWRLNARHYGDLTGQSKARLVGKFGIETVFNWRRGFETVLPPITKSNNYYKQIVTNPSLTGIFQNEEDFVKFETLKMTMERTTPYWMEVIVPQIQKKRNILIVSHGNTLRALVKYLDKIADTEIANLNIPTARPFVYNMDEDIRPLRPLKYLGNLKEVEKALEKMVVSFSRKK